MKWGVFVKSQLMMTCTIIMQEQGIMEEFPKGSFARLFWKQQLEERIKIHVLGSAYVKAVSLLAPQIKWRNCG